jgi:hypothetical protein
LHPITRTVAIVALVDFAVFIAVSLVLGGDGLNGVEKGGHYFVSNHGTLTEVSYGAWLFSRIQSVTLLVLWPLMLLCLVVDSLRQREPAEEQDHSILGRKDAPPRRRR